MTKSVIKPCPFCGQEEPVYMFKEGKSYAVVCDFNWGGCGACGGFRETPKEAAEAWNRRVNHNNQRTERKGTEA